MTRVKILVVEDELIAAESLALDLKSQGYQVVGIVDSGTKAISATTTTKPDLILMDILLKGEIDGISASEKIRDQFQVPVVYLTAYADMQTLKRAKKTFPYGYIVKPYKPQDLASTIEIALEKYQQDCKIQSLLKAEQALNQLKSRTLAITSHDLRTPLATILSSIELLRYYGETWSQDKKDKHFNRIESTVAEMTELLEDLLITRNIEEGKLNLCPQLFDVVEFCVNLIEDFRLTLTEKHHLVFVNNGSYKYASLDAKLLRHILNNLLSNACKYSPLGGKILVELKCEANLITLQVQDQGIGMPQESQRKVFQIFERASNVGKIRGTGLGLYIVKQAVELHKGSIKVTSKEEIGTSFTVKLPCASF